ncbi:MAG: hypothetical protein ABI554_14490 [Flavobacterium sp.]
MIQFWIIAILIFLTIILILAKLTLKKSRKERGEKMWKLWDGMTKYWYRISLASMGITACIVFIARWIGFPGLE